MGVLQSSPLQGFLPHLMLLVLHVQIRHLSENLACHLSLARPLKIVVVLMTPPAIFPVTVAFQKSAIMTESLLAPTVATVGDAVQGSPLLLSQWESPQGVVVVGLVRCEEGLGNGRGVVICPGRFNYATTASSEHPD